MQNRRVQNNHGVHSPVRLDGVQAEAAALEHRAGAAGARPLCSVRVWHAAIPTRREAAPCSLPSRTTEETVEEREMCVWTVLGHVCGCVTLYWVISSTMIIGAYVS